MIAAETRPEDRLVRDELAIFLFHGVVDAHRHAVRNYTRKHIDAGRFRRVLEALARAGTPVSLDDVAARRGAWPARPFAITFDDGFANNLTVAAPILAGMGLPATFYFTTRFVEQNEMSWIDRIELCLERAESGALRLPWREEPCELAGAATTIALLAEIRTQVKSDPAIEVDAFVASIFDQCRQPTVRASDDPLDRKLDWEQVRALRAIPGFTIGGHGHRHRILSFLSPPDLEAEIATSLRLIEEKGGGGVRHYSYPEGLRHCYSDHVIEALKRHGIACCPTAEDGTNPPGTDPFRLRRISVV